MIEIEFSIWLASKENWVHLTKNIKFPSVPRVGEYVKFSSASLGDYFSWRVTQVTYRENGYVEVWTELLDNIDDRMYSFEDDCDFQEYLLAYQTEGWVAPYGVKENTRYRQQNA
ncbi:hypothetical protein A3K86_00030 [Photobacterium jeanii]|uniref:Uncharacterized protein n=1 Tax=Photobacterium jeanii TaxID=858640 RepID=A0A178KRY8_9GAMM|nr:hypothetical protein [Photobacterium jeanii]OAN19876.1 hypothetical protein A3K86_00030 [Photobacterium jeanii]PST85855.1 hypothetical protein C9I91_22395 [Photobacterium jeanii]